jgi:hypothetical protein
VHSPNCDYQAQSGTIQIQPNHTFLIVDSWFLNSASRSSMNKSLKGMWWRSPPNTTKILFQTEPVWPSLAAGLLPHYLIRFYSVRQRLTPNTEPVALLPLVLRLIWLKKYSNWASACFSKNEPFIITDVGDSRSTGTSSVFFSLGERGAFTFNSGFLLVLDK